MLTRVVSGRNALPCLSGRVKSVNVEVGIGPHHS